MLSVSAGSEPEAGVDVVLGFVQLQVVLTERLLLALTVGDRSPAQPKHLCCTGSTPVRCQTRGSTGAQRPAPISPIYPAFC